MEIKGISWMTWNLKEDQRLASEFSIGDKFILWRSPEGGGIEGVVGHGSVIREYEWEKSPEHVWRYHRDSTYKNKGNIEYFRIRIEPEQWGITGEILKSQYLYNMDSKLSRKDLMPFAQQGTYHITKEQYDAIISIYDSWMSGVEMEYNDPADKRDFLVDEVEIKNSGRRGTPRSGNFRKRVQKAYRGKCAITGSEILEIVIAAHIDPFNNSPPELRHNDDVSNGILLREDIHKLFDKHLIAINPEDMRIVVSESIKDKDDYYKRYHNRELKSKPLNGEEYPNRDALQRRLELLRE